MKESSNNKELRKYMQDFLKEFVGLPDTKIEYKDVSVESGLGVQYIQENENNFGTHKQGNVNILIFDILHFSFNYTLKEWEDELCICVSGHIDCILEGKANSPEMDATFVLNFGDSKSDFKQFIQSVFNYLINQKVIRNNPELLRLADNILSIE